MRDASTMCRSASHAPSSAMQLCTSSSLRANGGGVTGIAPPIQHMASGRAMEDLEGPKITIHLVEGKGFVWDVEAVRRIREKHGIVGNLVGALVRKPRQNMRLGLPLQLMPEETRLLVDTEAASLVHSCVEEDKCGDTSEGPTTSTSLSSTVDEEVSSKAAAGAYQQFLQKSYEEQRQMALEERRRTLENLSERIVEGRAKRKRKKPRREEQEEPMESSPQGPVKELQNLEETFRFPREAMLVQIPTARVTPGNVEEVDLSQASVHWPYAGQKRHELRYKVFRDLWEKGYYLTSGSKFGGDFLVYPGDPMRFHAHYIVICFPLEEEIPLSDIITAGRLGTNVKKTVLLCSSNKEGLVSYTSLQWSGMS